MSVGEFINVEVEGLKELEENLNKLSEDLAAKVLRAAARKAMRKMQDRVRANAPRGKRPLQKGRTIRLAEGILMSASFKSEGVRGGSVLVRVGLRTKPKDKSVWYGRLVEFGVPARHIPARPFMRSAFDTEKENVLKEFADELAAGIERVARRARSKV